MFKNLVRKSRVFSLPELPVGTDAVPYEQVLKTTSANKHRKNWGIKYNLPSKASSTLITQSALDTTIGMPKVEYGGRHARRVAKLIETGASLQRNEQMLGEMPKQMRSIHDLSIKGVKDLAKKASKLRDEYQAYRFSTSVDDKFLLSKPPTVRHSAEAFLGLDSSNISKTKAASGIGATYTLQGVAHNTPQGIKSDLPFLGRMLPKGGSGEQSSVLVAAAGFVGNCKNLPTQARLNAAVPQQKPINVAIDRAEVRDGVISIKASKQESE